MQETLVKKLYEYIRDNNPDLLLTLQEQNRLTDYLRSTVSSVDELIIQLTSEGRPASLIEEVCMEKLTRSLIPSRYNYLRNLLEEEFPNDYARLYEGGMLTTEIVNLITASDHVFDELNFSEETENDRNLRYAITGVVYDYLQKEKSE